VEPSLESSVARGDADFQVGCPTPRDTVNLFICSDGLPTVCSQKSRQNKEEVQEVLCWNGKSLEDAEEVKERGVILTAFLCKVHE